MDRKLKAFDDAIEDPRHKKRPQGRPMGLLLLWLDFDCKGVLADHKAIAARWALVAGMKFEERCTARQLGMQNPLLADVFKEEREPFAEETRGEPHLLCGF
jgi:hypothetical protein